MAVVEQKELEKIGEANRFKHTVDGYESIDALFDQLEQEAR